MLKKKIEFIPISGFPLIQKNDNIAQIIVDQLTQNQFEPDEYSVFVIASKIISIAENAVVNLDNIKASENAYKLAKQTKRSPEECQVYLDESSEVLGVVGRNVICRHKKGYVCTSAGIDKSNASPENKNIVTLLPYDADESANKIRVELEKQYQKKFAVIISDTAGRENRHGSICEAIGISGISTLEKTNTYDLYGRKISPKIALIDRIAAGASIVMGESNEHCPVVIGQGINYTYMCDSTISEILK